jgi:hypothetical protein
MAQQAANLKVVKEDQPEIWKELDRLSQRFGPEVLRIAGQRYFKRKREQARLQAEIAERERELERLKNREQKP